MDISLWIDSFSLLYKNLYVHEGYFGVLLFYSSHVAILRAYFDEVAGLYGDAFSWLVVIVFFRVVSRHLGFGNIAFLGTDI